MNMFYKCLWSILWRLELLLRMLKQRRDAGDHKFIRGKCLCGRITKDEPERCTVFWRKK